MHALIIVLDRNNCLDLIHGLGYPLIAIQINLPCATVRVIDLYEQSSRQIRLTQQLDRGSDFERCTFDNL